MKHFTKMYLFYIGFKIDSGTQLVETFSKNHEIHKKKSRQSEMLICFDMSGWRDKQRSTVSLMQSELEMTIQIQTRLHRDSADWSHDSRGMRKLHATAEVSRTISQQPHKCWSLFCRAARGNKTGQGRRAKSADLSGLVLILLLLFGSQLSTDFHDKAARLCFRIETGTSTTINPIKLNWPLAN